jgi:hypothetical protein
MQVYVTMYLNDTQRTGFYESIGLNTKEFDMHVIIEVSLCSGAKKLLVGLGTSQDRVGRCSAKESVCVCQIFVWRSYPNQFYKFD